MRIDHKSITIYSAIVGANYRTQRLIKILSIYHKDVFFTDDKDEAIKWLLDK